MGVNIWLMKGFLDTIPRDIDKSAMVEGATNWQIFTQLILPLLRPILIVIFILNYISTYGEFVLARILLQEQRVLHPDGWTANLRRRTDFTSAGAYLPLEP